MQLFSLMFHWSQSADSYKPDALYFVIHIYIYYIFFRYSLCFVALTFHWHSGNCAKTNYRLRHEWQRLKTLSTSRIHWAQLNAAKTIIITARKLFNVNCILCRNYEGIVMNLTLNFIMALISQIMLFEWN